MRAKFVLTDWEKTIFRFWWWCRRETFEKSDKPADWCINREKG